MFVRHKCGNSTETYGACSRGGATGRRLKSDHLFVQPKRVPGGDTVFVKAKLPDDTPTTDPIVFQPN